MAALLSVFLLLVQSPPDLSIDDVLANVERYLADYEPQLSHCVAREEYVQRFTSPGGRTRRLTSDFLFIRSGNNNAWLGVRSVSVVDGNRVESSAERLKEIVRASPADARKLSEEIAKDNARHNIGIARTVNVPTLILGWLRGDVRRRLRFSRAGVETFGSVKVLRLDFKEGAERPTLIRSDYGDLESYGAIWVEPATGRVWQTELRNHTNAASFRMRVRYTMDPRLKILVPVRMEENVEGLGAQRGDATYSNYRRFGVTSRIK